MLGELIFREINALSSRSTRLPGTHLSPEHLSPRHTLFSGTRFSPEHDKLSIPRISFSKNLIPQNLIPQQSHCQESHSPDSHSPEISFPRNLIPQKTHFPHILMSRILLGPMLFYLSPALSCLGFCSKLTIYDSRCWNDCGDMLLVTFFFVHFLRGCKFFGLQI